VAKLARSWIATCCAGSSTGIGLANVPALSAGRFHWLNRFSTKYTGARIVWAIGSERGCCSISWLTRNEGSGLSAWAPSPEL
jgi:hypothetical protein